MPYYLLNHGHLWSSIWKARRGCLRNRWFQAERPGSANQHYLQIEREYQTKGLAHVKGNVQQGSVIAGHKMYYVVTIVNASLKSAKTESETDLHTVLFGDVMYVVCGIWNTNIQCK
jgi:hypothetical protein